MSRTEDKLLLAEARIADLEDRLAPVVLTARIKELELERDSLTIRLAGHMAELEAAMQKLADAHCPDCGVLAVWDEGIAERRKEPVLTREQASAGRLAQAVFVPVDAADELGVADPEFEEPGK